MVDKNVEKDLKNKEVEKDDVGMTCIPDEGKYKDGPFEPKDVPKGGTYKEHKGPKREDTATDVYYKTECKLPGSKVSVPTKDSVDEAKEWVDDENKM